MNTADRVIQALQPYKLKEEGKNRYRCNSPLRPGSNSHAFTLTIEGDEHGAFFDHVSGEKGSLYDLAKLLGVDLPEKTPVASTKRGYSGLAEYAQAHGLTAEELQRWQWRETMRDDRLALEFPTRTGKRWRFLDGKKPYYKSETGYQRCWYGLSSEVMKTVSSGAPLVVCNGEISTIAGQRWGLAAIAVTSGENAIPPELVDDLTWAIDKDKHEIIIALDCDRKGITAAHQIAAQFKSQGYKVRAVDLGLGHSGDLADFCMLHGDGSSAALLKLPTLSPEIENDYTRNWTIIHASQLKNLPTVSWLVPGEIPEKGMTVVYGPSGVGKSFLSLDYALTVAQQRVVVYVAAEGESGYHLRVSAWCKHNNLSEGKLYLCLGSPNLMDEPDLEAFINTIARLSPSMVVVDTLAMAMIGGDENSARDMGRVIMASRLIQRETDSAVVLVHHTNKGGSVERGSGALRGAADSMIRVTGDDDLILIESSKSKDTAPFDTRYMKLLPVLTDSGESRVLVKAAQVVQRSQDALTGNQKRILEAMTLAVFKDGATVLDIEETTGLSRGSVQRTISKLMELGFVEQPGKREPYRLTEAGRLKANDSFDSHDSFDSPSHSGNGHESSNRGDKTSQTSQTSQGKLFDAPGKPRNNYTEGL